MLSKVLPLIGGTLAVAKSMTDSSEKEKKRKKDMQKAKNEDIQYEKKIKGIKARQEHEREESSKQELLENDEMNEEEEGIEKKLRKAVSKKRMLRYGK